MEVSYSEEYFLLKWDILVKKKIIFPRENLYVKVRKKILIVNSSYGSD